MISKALRRGSIAAALVFLACTAAQAAPALVDAAQKGDLKAVKSLLREAPDHALPEQLESERRSFVDCLHHPDALEGMTAFLEKRKPHYR